MIRTDADEGSMKSSLEEVVELFDLAKSTVFKLMASASTPVIDVVGPHTDFVPGFGSQIHSSS
jgi:hypothetical protein